jgi:hypothetical protein
MEPSQSFDLTELKTKIHRAIEARESILQKAAV